MRDLAMTFKEFFCDLDLSGMDLAGENGLYTACLVSLFTDRVADASDELPAGETSLRGWWGDVHLPANDHIGSKLWLLRREKQTPAVAERARRYCAEALQWLVDDGHVKGVEVSAAWSAPGVLAVAVRILDPDLSYDFTYQLIQEAS